VSLSPGSQAPDCTLFARPKEPVHLRDYLGGSPVVLMFFPMAFSAVCTAEMCSTAEEYGEYRDMGAQVLGISVDSPYTNVRFAESCGAPFPILSDFNREAIHAFDVVRPDLGGLRDVAERVVYVIDREGRIHWVWQGQHPGVMPPFDEIRAAVRSAMEKAATR
jgi:peroxiredoxin